MVFGRRPTRRSVCCVTTVCSPGHRPRRSRSIGAEGALSARPPWAGWPRMGQRGERQPPHRPHRDLVLQVVAAGAGARHDAHLGRVALGLHRSDGLRPAGAGFDPRSPSGRPLAAEIVPPLTQPRRLRTIRRGGGARQPPPGGPWPRMGTKCRRDEHHGWRRQSRRHLGHEVRVAEVGPGRAGADLHGHRDEQRPGGQPERRPYRRTTRGSEVRIGRGYYPTLRARPLRRCL